MALRNRQLRQNDPGVIFCFQLFCLAIVACLVLFDAPFQQYRGLQEWFRQRRLERSGQVPSTEIPSAPSCTTPALFVDDSKTFALDIRQFSALVTGLQESDIEDDVLHSNLLDKYVIHDYLRMTKVVARLFEPALKRYIKKASPDVKHALASSDTIIFRLNLRSSPTNSSFFGFFWKPSDSRKRHLEDAVSSNLEMYSVIQRDLGPHDDVIYCIINLLQEYLDDLAAVLSASSSSKDCKLQTGPTGIWTHLRSTIGIGGTGTEDLVHVEDCMKKRRVEGRVDDVVQHLRSSVHNLRDHFDNLQSDINDLGDQSLNFLLAGIGRPIPIKQYLGIMSTLVCGGTRVQDLLGIASA